MARKILLADDSVTAQNMGRKILADAGYDVITVNNGSAALKRITEAKPDLIVLDVYMPGYSGLEVCQRLKDAAETAHIPVLLTVGKLEPFKPEEARRVKADGHIVKPFEASELLTAITRLEDRMVPQQSEGGRFSTSVSGVERFGSEERGRRTDSDADADTGWKSRLRFPSKKKKEETEPESEDAAAGATFRDFRKGKGKTGASGVFSVKAPPPPGQEPGLVPDIPRDITPEELDALSALAEKLDGPIPAAENIAPLAEKMGPVEAPVVEVAAEKNEAAETEVEVPAVAAEAKKELETSAPVVEATAAAVETPAVAVEGRVESKSEVEVPIEPVEPATKAAAAVADAAALLTPQHETEHPGSVNAEAQPPETPATAAAAPVNTALLAQEPAPVDKSDEPMFASAAKAVEPAAEAKIEEKPLAAIATSAAAEASAPADAVVAEDVAIKPEESKAQESRAEESQAEQSKAEKIAQPVPVAASVPESTEAEEPAPSDAELAEALRLLTPATAYTDVSTVPSHGTLVAAGQLLAEEAARNAAAAPRWIAEPVALTPEEAALSLEAEMFRTFAATPATMSATASGGVIETVAITGVSAIAAAVENRLAAAGLAPTANAPADQGTEDRSDTIAEPSLAEASEAVGVGSTNTASPVDGIGREKIAEEKIEAEKDSPAKAAEEATVEEVAAATFADAVGRDEVAATAEQNGEAVSGSTAAVAEENQDSSSDSGGQESMGKSKSGKSNWHQIHTTPTAAAASNDVETAKQAGAEETPKVMAATAAAEGSKSSATDASTIASIVDSVMADLRPKIVEEIAKKLAKRD